MTEPMPTLSETDVTDNYSEEADLATAHLSGGAVSPLDSEAGQFDTTDWLTLLATRTTLPSLEDYDQPPEAPLPPSGMVAHTAPPRMRPTVGARLTTGLRRALLLCVLGIVAVGAVGGGVYVISSTTWFSAAIAPAGSVSSTAPAPTGKGQLSPAVQAQPKSSAAQPQEAAGATTEGASPQDLRDKANSQYRAGNYGQAIDLLESVQQMYGGDAVTYYQLGLAYMAATGRDHAMEDAEMAFRTAISMQPAWAPPHHMLAESLLRRGFSKEAVEPAKEATTLDPTQSEAWMTLGRALQADGRQAEATQAFAEAARHAPPPPSKP